jgi:hypothetical protein
LRNGTGAVVRGFGRTAAGEVERERALVTAEPNIFLFASLVSSMIVVTCCYSCIGVVEMSVVGFPPTSSRVRFVVTMLLHSMRVLVRFGARNAFLTVTEKKCMISFIHAVKTHIYAGGRKPLIWLRPPPSAPIKSMCF